MKPAGPILALIVSAALGGAFAYQHFYQRQAGQARASQEHGPASMEATRVARAPSAKRDAGTAGVGTASALPALELDKQVRIAQPGTSQVVPRREWPSRLERALVQGNGVDGGATQSLLASGDFDGYLAQLSRDADADAIARARDYRQVLEESLAEVTKGAELDRIACGRDFCIAAIRSRPGSDFGAWYRSIQSATPIPMQVMTSETIPQPDGAADHRVFFTTNPAVNSVSVPPGPRPQPRTG